MMLPGAIVYRFHSLIPAFILISVNDSEYVLSKMF
jgi:hypothetical protein